MWKRKVGTLLGLLVLVLLSIVLSAGSLGLRPILLSPREWGFTKTERAIVTPHNLVVVEVVRVGCIGLQRRIVYPERVRQLWLNRRTRR